MIGMICRWFIILKRNNSEASNDW